MQLSTLQYKEYTGRVTNLSQKKDITKYVEECNIALPHTTYISSMEAKFTLDEKLVEVGNEVKIEVLDEVGNTLYTLQGKATIPRRIKQHTGTELFEYSIKDSYGKLFEKVVAKDMTFYDLYFCNIRDKSNSLLHKIAESLGFREEQCNFQNATLPNGQYMRVPFIYFEENTRWVDKLQAFLEATNGVLYVQNGVLHFRLRDSSVDTSFQFDRSNLLNHIEESQKEVLQNGVKVVYDRFELLENQVVFNLQSKVIVEPNTSINSNVPTMRLSYITSSVSNPTLTKATGYYFTSEDPNSKVDITLQENVHYKIENWSATGAEVKFYNPLSHRLYIDSFEIKGVPLAMYENNEVNVMFPTVTEKTQENFTTLPKTLMVQTQEQATYLAKQAMQKMIVNGKEYSFTTEFLHQIQVGKRYHLDLEDIQADVEVRSIQISLKPNQFRMDIVADSLTEPLGEVKTSNKHSANPKGQYIDLKPVEEKVNQAKEEVKRLERDVRSKLYRMESVPTEEVKESDVWLNPQTNEWKKFYNGVWNPISEREILPSMKMYNSVESNFIKLQGTNDKVGAYLLNDGEKFGGLNGELAHTTFDKLGQFESVNPNNKIALNIKDPASPQKVTSQILLGVADVTEEKWDDVVFAIGDESTGNSIQFKNGQLSQTVGGEPLEDKIDDINTVKGALENGTFTINANTTFAEGVRFVSQGTNEVVTIANGAIDFHRNGQKLTRIKNIKYGTLTTDSKGREHYTFEGFEQPMVVMTSIKSANFGKNMASVFCYAEHVSGTRYRFYVGGTNEHWKEPTPIKVVGTEWRADNAVEATLLEYSSKMTTRTFSKYIGTGGNITPNTDYLENVQTPKVRIEIVRLEGNSSTTLVTENLNTSVRGWLDSEQGSRIYKASFRLELSCPGITKHLNILKKYSSRTNVKFQMRISFLNNTLRATVCKPVKEPSRHYENGIVVEKRGRVDVVKYTFVENNVLRLSDFQNYIVASSSTSTLSGVTGTGEVAYIAMEVE